MIKFNLTKFLILLLASSLGVHANEATQAD